MAHRCAQSFSIIVHFNSAMEISKIVEISGGSNIDSYILANKSVLGVPYGTQVNTKLVFCVI